MSAPFAPVDPGPRIASLCKGFGGLDLGLQAVLGGTVVAYAEIKAAAVALLADRFPGVPNLGDLTVADWSQVVADIVTAGWPCQPHSSAGKRLGEEDPRAIWYAVLDVVRVVRPLLFVGENVARTATNGELRRALRPLAAIGYVGAWRCLPAGDPSVGAPHKRDRLLLVAVDASVPHAEAERRIEGWTRAARESRGDGPGPAVGGGEPLEDVTLLPTPTQSMTTGAGTSGRDGGLNLQTAVTLLPTPNTGMGKAGTPNAELAQARLDSGRRNLQDAIGALLPTPTARDGKGAHPRSSRNDGAARSAAQLDLPGAVTLLPTPSASSYGTNQGGAAGRTGPVRESLDTMAKRGRLGDGARLLPTHRVSATRTSKGAALSPESRSSPSLDQALEIGRGELPREFASWDEFPASWRSDDIDDAPPWGPYAGAIARWTPIVGREAPEPTQPSSRAPHGPQLSPEFVEWLMGVPKGWVTNGAPGLGVDKRGRWTASGQRTAFLSLLGDGVVWQWAAVQVEHVLPLALDALADLVTPHERDPVGEVIVVADLAPTMAYLQHLARSASRAGLWIGRTRAAFSARKPVVQRAAVLREARAADEVTTLRRIARRARDEGVWTDDVREVFTARRLEIESGAAA